MLRHRYPVLGVDKKSNIKVSFFESVFYARVLMFSRFNNWINIYIMINYSKVLTQASRDIRTALANKQHMYQLDTYRALPSVILRKRQIQ